MTSAAGHAFRSTLSATEGWTGSKFQSISNMSVRLIGACANVVVQSEASPATSILRSSNIRRSAERSSVRASATYTRVMYSSYDISSPGVSCVWGVFVSATWGSFSWSANNTPAQCNSYRFCAAGHPQFGQDITDMGLNGG